MNIIPAIDLKGGQVVAAAGGARASYRSLQSPLCVSSSLGDVVSGLLTYAPFSDLYIADLDAIAGDAISGNGGHALEIAQIAASYPNLRIWLDAGTGDLASAQQVLRHENLQLVVGSETLTDVAAFAALKAAFGDRVVLSLDFRGPDFLGPQELLDRPNLWPSRVLVMSLAHVGRRAGPDSARLHEIISIAGVRQVFSAGGVRDRADIATLHKMGAAGALVATALHHGQIKTDDLEEIAGW